MTTTAAFHFDDGKLRANLADLRRKIGDRELECGELTATLAKDMSPVGTPGSTGIPGYVGGTNKRSIAFEEKRATDQNLGWAVYTQSGYGGYLEIGTSRMAARPYIRPAFDRAVGMLERALKGIA